MLRKNNKKDTLDIEKVNQADSMIYQNKKQLKEYGDKIPADKKQPIEEALAEVKSAHAAQDAVAIDASMEKLNTAWNAASQEIYAAMNEGQQGGAQELPERELCIPQVPVERRRPCLRRGGESRSRCRGGSFCRRPLGRGAFRCAL